MMQSITHATLFNVGVPTDAISQRLYSVVVNGAEGQMTITPGGDGWWIRIIYTNQTPSINQYINDRDHVLWLVQSIL